MTVKELGERMGLTMLCPGDQPDREIEGKVYCCDLLSIVMGRAPAGGVWVTVMANVNTVAVAVLCDLSCVIIAEGMQVDEPMLEKAREQGITVFHTELPVFETAKAADRLMHDEA